MADVLINYARPDSSVAQELVAALESRGLRSWRDRDLMPGDNFVEAIQDAMANAACVLTLWTPHSVTSNRVLAEARWAMENGKLLPVSIDGAEIPLPFRGIQTLFVRFARKRS